MVRCEACLWGSIRRQAGEQRGGKGTVASCFRVLPMPQLLRSGWHCVALLAARRPVNRWGTANRRSELREGAGGLPGRGTVVAVSSPRSRMTMAEVAWHSGAVQTWPW